MFPGRLLYRGTLSNGRGKIEVRIRHCLLPTMPAYWSEVNAMTRDIIHKLGIEHV